MQRTSGEDILFVMALESEYGPCLRERISPLITGVGPVEAAISITRELARREVSGTLPALVVSLGSAGSRTLQQCAVFQATTVSYRDMDASPLGFAKGETPFLDCPVALPLSTVRGIATATLSSGGNVVSGAAYDGIDADMVDMESFSAARVCASFGLPLICLRGISDGVSDLTSLADWTQYLHIVDRELAAAVDIVKAAWAAKQVQIPEVC